MKRRIAPALYCLWAAVAIGFSIALAGLSPESVTRLLVIGFLFGQVALRATLVKALPGLAPKTRFIVLGTLLAAVVEGFHMISMPVFQSLRIGGGTSLAQGLKFYALDLLFTAPAYLVIFSVIWFFVGRYRYSTWQYVIVMGLAQALGDGGLFFFVRAPAMLFFIPYPMTNYHAINVVPFLAVRDQLGPGRAGSARAYLAVPAVVGTYLVCGAIIKLVGRWFGLESS
ncbi:MAG: hypothetical protein NEA02_08870 [Thermoanaerobaculia bacterium]|nr:hypothetical protein [Thermoanaerobaculia bacterium]